MATARWQARRALDEVRASVCRLQTAAEHLFRRAWTDARTLIGRASPVPGSDLLSGARSLPEELRWSTISRCSGSEKRLDAGGEIPQAPVRQRVVGVGGNTRVQTRILLAEPDVELRTAIASALRVDGYEVEEAANGADLLLRAGSEMACVHGGRASLVLVVAAGLPVFSASEILEILHRFRWDLPCIILSRAPHGVEHTRARVLGAVAVLGSPPRIEQLRAILRAQADPGGARAHPVVGADAAT